MAVTHPFHDGELAAQMRFNEPWSEERSVRLGHLIGKALDDEKALFIERLPFFFLATADAEGNCDCSFRGTERTSAGERLPVVWVAEPMRVLFPDYSGNGMFNSLGNIIQNGHVGLLFLDFASQTRLRVNGSARILDGSGQWQCRWPAATRAVEVDVHQVYWNCSKRIPTRA